MRYLLTFFGINTLSKILTFLMSSRGGFYELNPIVRVSLKSYDLFILFHLATWLLISTAYLTLKERYPEMLGLARLSFGIFFLIELGIDTYMFLSHF